MGDLVLTEKEVPAVISALQQRDVQESAVPNHLLRESPRIVYVHIEAEGDPVRIATAIRAALDLTSTRAPPSVSASVSPIDLDTALIHRTLGYEGKVNGGVYQVSLPRREKVMMNKKGHQSVAFFSDERGLVFAILVLEGESIRLTNAVEHGIDRNCDAPVVQRGFVARSSLEPTPHFGRRLCTARTSRLFVRGGIRTIHVHSTSTGSVFFAAILSVPRNDSLEPRQ